MTDADKIVIKAEAMRTAYNACNDAIDDCVSSIDYLKTRLDEDSENQYYTTEIEKNKERIKCLESIAKAILKL